ncbi:MAG TPA: permease, partial [Candidatus Fimicola cottocaccae]|nr:permease [Candidatus Fimicola cottocaccae]
MKWLNEIIGNLLKSLGIDISTRLGGSLQFWIYDVLKIFILLSFLIFFISLIESYFPPEKCKRILGKYKGVFANTVAALLGTVTPFCSCSSIPIFIGFTNAGLSMGITFSFLISSPLVDLGSLVLLSSIFGFEIAFLYVILGVVLAVIGGTIIEKMSLSKYIEDDAKDELAEQRAESWRWIQENRIPYAFSIVKGTIKKVYLYVLIGVGIGAIIHNWIPQEIIMKLLGSNNPFSVIVATVIGIPMYADIFGTIPIAEALYFKGAGLGVVLSFMMGVTALSLPSMIMLRKVVKPKLLGIFVAIVTVGIIITG